MRRLFIAASVVLGLIAWLLTAPAASAATIDPSGVTASVQGLNVAASWQDGDSTGVTGYIVSTSPPSPTVSVPAGATSAVLTGIRPGIEYTVVVTAQTAAGQGNPVSAANTVRTTAPGGSFVALAPARLLDTRSGLGAPKGATTLVALAVAGRGGVPVTGVSAVALNLTVTDTTSAGFVTAYPAGRARPLASNLNFTRGFTGANLVVVPVGTNGTVDLFASARTDLVADVAGYYTTITNASPSAGLFHALPPARLLDTRSGTGGSTPHAGGTVNLTVTGVGGVPATGVSAVVLNTTVTGPTAAGFVTTYPTGTTRPVASSLNFVRGQIVANRVVVPVGANGQVSLFNSNGSTPLIADVTGWYTDNSDASTGGSYYVAVTPHRLVDTRDGTGAPRTRIGEAGVLPVQIAGQDGLPAANAVIPPNAAALTVTVVDPTAAVFATVYPSLSERPLASDLNANPGQDVPNLALTGLGTDGAVDIFNSHGNSNYVVDLSGYFIGAIDVPSSTTTAAPGTITAVSGDPATTATLTLAVGAATPPIGQIITAGVTPATPDGLLVQVTGTSTDASGAPVVSTQPATLQQAVGNANIALSVPLSATDVQNNTRHTGLIGPSQLHARSLRAAAQTPIKGTSKQPCTTDASSSVDVTASVSPTLVFDAQLGHHGLVPSVSATAGVVLSEQTVASVEFGGTVDCQWSSQLGEFHFSPIEFDVAGVPVVIFPVFTLSVHATASGRAQISASVTQNFTAQAGLQDDDGKVTPFHSITNSISHTGPTITAASGNASVAVIGDLVGKLYDVAGPDVALTATVSATVNPVVSPWWTIGFTLAGTAALHFQVLVATVDVSATVNVLSVTVAQATGSSGGAPPVITTTKLPDAAVNQNYSTDLTTADHRKGTWAIAAGSLPFGMTLSGFTISGQPDTVGTNTFTLRFTDTTGHVVTARASITVVGGNGTVSGRVTDTHGDGLGNVTVQAFGTRNSGFLETDSDGDFTGSLPSGQYDFCFDGSTGTGGTSDATGYVFSCFDNNATLNVAPGGTVSGINVSLATGGAVSGQLTGHDGQPEGQAFIFPRDPSNGISAGGGANYVSNEDGSYTVKGLPTGSYALCFETLQEPTPANLGDVDKCYQNAPFSVTQTGGGTPVSVTAGKTTTGINLSFAEGGAISGRLTDANGNPVAGIAVSAEGDGPLGASGYDAGGHEATTDDNGDYEIGDLAPGTEYDVCDIGDTQHFFACFGGNTEPLATVTVTAGHVTPNVNWTVPTASGAAGARLTHG